MGEHQHSSMLHFLDMHRGCMRCEQALPSAGKVKSFRARCLFSASKHKCAAVCRYVSVCGNHIIDPSITATIEGVGVMTGSLVGASYYLSPFYATITLAAGKQPFVQYVSVNGSHSSLQLPVNKRACLACRPFVHALRLQQTCKAPQAVCVLCEQQWHWHLAAL